MARAVNLVEVEPRWITGEELARMPVKQREQLIEALLPATGLVLLSADAKAGKSTLALELCRAVTTDTLALERFRVQQGGAIFWMADDLSQERFVANYQAMCPTAPLPHFEVLFERRPLSDGGLRMLAEALDRTRAKLAVVDCLTAIRDTRAGDFVQQEYDELRALSDLAIRQQSCILLLHHLATGRRQAAANPSLGNAGSFALNAATDGMITLEMFSCVRSERVVTLLSRDAPATRFLYARDSHRRLFYIGGADWAEHWKEALEVYRCHRHGPLEGTTVAEILGLGERMGRHYIRRWVGGGILSELSERHRVWSEDFLKAAKRVLGEPQ